MIDMNKFSEALGPGCLVRIGISRVEALVVSEHEDKIVDDTSKFWHEWTVIGFPGSQTFRNDCTFLQQEYGLLFNHWTSDKNDIRIKINNMIQKSS